MTEFLEETSTTTTTASAEPRKVRSGFCNFVVLVNNETDDTLTATFLGTTLFKRLSVPIEAVFVEKLIHTLTDDDERAKFCVKRGISEQMANEAIRDGAAKDFEERLATFSPDYKPKKQTKKAVKDADNDEVVAPKENGNKKKRAKKEDSFQSPEKKKPKKAAAPKPKKNGKKTAADADDDNDDKMDDTTEKTSEKSDGDTPKSEEKKD